MTFRVPNIHRVRTGTYRSTDAEGRNGMFRLVGPSNRSLLIIASDGGGWEHVSVSTGGMPTWNEMAFVKGVFWSDDDVVMQLHPAKKDYVNNVRHCLHLWRPIDVPIPTPPTFMVGIPGVELPG